MHYPYTNEFNDHIYFLFHHFEAKDVVFKLLDVEICHLIKLLSKVFPSFLFLPMDEEIEFVLDLGFEHVPRISFALTIYVEGNILLCQYVSSSF